MQIHRGARAGLCACGRLQLLLAPSSTVTAHERTLLTLCYCACPPPLQGDCEALGLEGVASCRGGGGALEALEGALDELEGSFPGCAVHLHLAVCRHELPLLWGNSSSGYGSSYDDTDMHARAWCGCGNKASPACANAACAGCCSGCNRHGW